MQTKERINVMMMPREILFGDVTESEDEHDQNILSWYGDFKTRWNRSAKTIFGSAGTRKPTEEMTQEFLKRLRIFMLNEKINLSYVDMGTEKVAFATYDKRYCVKVSAPYDGYQSQIMDEVRILKDIGRPECVYDIIDWDSEGYTSMLCECCAEATEDDWTKAFGLPYSDIMRILDAFVECGTVRPTQKQFVECGSRLGLDTAFRYPEQRQALGEFLKRWFSDKSRQMESMRSFAQVRIDSSRQKLRDCVRHLENWGVSKDGVLKVIDIGL